MPNTTDHFLLICETCRGPLSVEDVRNQLKHTLPAGYDLRAVRCMAGCERPQTVGFQASGKAQYLFGDITSRADVEALAEFAQQYQRSEDGWTSATQRPRQLFTKTLSRMPRFEKEAGG